MTTTSQTQFLSDVLADEPIPAFKLAYFRGRLTNRIHALVLEEFERLSNAGLINKSKLAKRIGKKPEQVTRWLGSPGNWTIETLSDLLLAMKLEPVVSVSALAERKSRAVSPSLSVKANMPYQRASEAPLEYRPGRAIKPESVKAQPRSKRIGKKTAV